MEKTVKIGKKSVKLNNNIGWCFIYRNQFGQDIVPTLMPLLAGTLDVVGGVINEVGATDEISVREIAGVVGTDAMRDALVHLSALEITDFINITWAMAKCADGDIPEVSEWIKGFDNFPLDTLAPVLFEMIFSGVTSSKNWARLQEMIKGLKPKKTEKSTSIQSSSQDSKED